MSGGMKRFLRRVGHQLVGPDLTALRQEQARLHSQQVEHLLNLRVAMGRLMAREIAGSASSCGDAEFKVFSQFGEDGIIDYLIRQCDVSPSVFVEIGVENYGEANTRFLAEHRQWRGLIVDLNPRLAEDLARTNLDWRSQVRAASTFITRENARSIVETFAGRGEIGLLSVDIDGVDYWVLEVLVDLEPALVIVEYNALFGDAAAVSVPYEPSFDRTRPEFHSVYYGASLAAFDHLLSRHGYALVACNSAGNNAFFVRADRLGDLPAQSVAAAYRPRRFVEHRTADGALSGTVDPRAQLADVRDLPLCDVADGRRLVVADVLPG